MLSKLLKLLDIEKAKSIKVLYFFLFALFMPLLIDIWNKN